MDMHDAGNGAIEARDEHHSSEAINRKLEKIFILVSHASNHLLDIKERGMLM
jgi:hypothetical protein